MRILLLLAVAVTAGLTSYLFISPARLEQAYPRAQLHASTAGIARAPLGASARQQSAVARAVANQELAATQNVRAGLVDNPARAGGRAREALLQLPRALPNRALTIPILMYHHISSAPPATQLNYGLTVTDTDFAAQLAYLGRHGYHTITLRRLFGALYEHQALPRSPIVLTFDDGYLDNYTDAFPMLKRYRDVGEFNIITAYPGITLGVNTYMTWGQIKAMLAAGMEIESHTVDHQDLGLMPEDHVRFELRDSRSILQRRLGVPVQFLAYPDGQPFQSGSVAARQLLIRLLPEYGYVGALLDGPTSTAAQHAQTPFQLSRIRVSGGEGLHDFAASLQQ